MLKFSDKTMKKKEEHLLLNYSLIKFKENIKIKKIEDVFNNLFNESKETYYLTNQKHCSANKGRSYYDAFLLCKYYFPEITFKEMYLKLYDLIEKQNPNHKKSSYYWHNKPGFFTCPTIGRARFIGILKF